MRRSGSSSSLLRRSGSSSCLLRPRSSLSLTELAELESAERPSVTVVNTTELPRYGAERYYVLSELEMLSHSVRFLCDYPPPSPDGLGGLGGLGLVDDHDSGGRGGGRIPGWAVLYLLWRPGTYPSARSFAEGPLLESLRRLAELRGGDASAFDDADSSSPSTSPGAASPGSPPPSPRRYRRSPSGGGRAASFGASPQAAAAADVAPPPDIKVRVYVVVDRLTEERTAAADADAAAATTRGGGRDGFLPESMPPPPPLPDDYSDAPSMDAEPSPASATATAASEPSRRRRHGVETLVAEDLAKRVASSRVLRPLVEGIAVGTTSDVRSAPGLEVCLSIVASGAAERRRAERTVRSSWPWIWGGGRSADPYGDGNGRDGDGGGDGDGAELSRSPVAVVAPHPDDVVGLDPERESHASQGVMQSRTVAEWSGNGDYVCFARRAMVEWRERHGIEGGEEEDVVCAAGGAAAADGTGGRRRVRRRRRSCAPDDTDDDDDGPGLDSDDMMTAAAVVVIVTVVTYLWGRYGDTVRGIAHAIGTLLASGGR